MSVKPFQINSCDKLYYNMKDLTILSPEFFYGCKTKPRNIIQKKNTYLFDIPWMLIFFYE